jgi:hypothetical protein
MASHNDRVDRGLAESHDHPDDYVMGVYPDDPDYDVQSISPRTHRVTRPKTPFWGQVWQKIRFWKWTV